KSCSRICGSRTVCKLSGCPREILRAQRSICQIVAHGRPCGHPSRQTVRVPTLHRAIGSALVGPDGYNGPAPGPRHTILPGFCWPAPQSGMMACERHRARRPGTAMLTNLELLRPLAVLDLETTGTDPQADRIVEISVLRLAPGGGREHRT